MRSLAAALFAFLLAACGGGSPGPTWYRDVEPVVQENCQGCHVEGGIAPFALKTAAQAKAQAAKMAVEVQARRMPPWPPGPAGVALQHSRALSDAQIALIAAWAKAGAPAGSSDDHRERPPKTLTVRDDLTLSMVQNYTPNANLTDDYRCFVMDPHVADSTYVTGYDIRAGVPAQVHHVILFVVLDQGDALAQLAALDGKDGQPGYTCFGGPMVDSTVPTPLNLPPWRFLGGWAPGAGAMPMPAGTGVVLPPRARVVMQVHYNARNGRAPDLSSVALELTPVGVHEAFLFPVAAQSFAIPPGASAAPALGQFTLPPSMAVSILGAFPHMHLFGTEITVSLASAGKPAQTLIDIPRWDFHWQGSYLFQAPVPAAGGDRLQVRCVYDNSAGNQPLGGDGLPMAPAWLRWGEKTTDEMCLVFLYATL